MSEQTIREDDLHAYVDGLLDAPRRAEVEAHLAAHPHDTERVRVYQQQNAQLHALFDPLLDETVPPRLLTTPRTARLRPVLLRYAAVAGWLMLGGIVGWFMHGTNAGFSTAEPLTFARQAALAYAVYAPDQRHPVEVGVDQEAHLVAWLSKRLGTPLKPPHLSQTGYDLLGGRLLPGGDGPVAQFMYQDNQGRRLALYVRVAAQDSGETAFRFLQQDKIGVFYWIDGKFGYALSGEMDKAELLRIANAVYAELNR